jgi:SAM-dependent methyltransferase
MTNIGIRIVILLILQTLWLETSHSQNPSSPKLNEEVSKQESILHSEGEQVPEGYTIDRSLLVYTEGLCSEFDRTLANLGPKDRWLDIGAGQGQAILDYYTLSYDLKHTEGRERRGKKAQAVAISIEDRRTPLWQQSAARLGANQIRYLVNRRLREYSLEELGQFQVITDVIGGFSYTENLSLFVEKVLGFLELNGSFYTVLQDVHSENGTKRPFYAGSPFLTEIANADGSEVRVCSWLKSITCVEVTCELRADWKPPIEAFHVRKVCNDVTVPALVPIKYEAGTPPERRYQLRN